MIKRRLAILVSVVAAVFSVLLALPSAAGAAPANASFVSQAEAAGLPAGKAAPCRPRSTTTWSNCTGEEPRCPRTRSSCPARS